MKWMRGILFATLAISLGSPPARAHDLWVVPGKFFLKAGEKTSVFVNTGDKFPESTALLTEDRIVSFKLITASGSQSLSGFRADGNSLTSELAVPEPGTAVLALGIKPRLIRLNAEQFSEYLKEDGLPDILKLRAELGESDQAVTERYTKWAKAILKAGDKDDDAWSKAAGFKIEIVPERNPLALKPEENLPVVVLFDGQPLSGLTVTGARAGGPRNQLGGVTDAEGRLALTIPEAGRWYLHTIHMLRLKEDPEAQWESFWATLTFEILP